MNHDVAVSTAREIADRVLAPAASQNDKQGRFSAEAVEALGKGGLLGLMLPINFGGGALGPRTFAGVTATLAEAYACLRGRDHCGRTVGTCSREDARRDRGRADSGYASIQ